MYSYACFTNVYSVLGQNFGTCCLKFPLAVNNIQGSVRSLFMRSGAVF